MFCFQMLLLMSALCAAVVIQRGGAQPEAPPYEVLSTEGVCTITELLLILTNILHTCELC